LPGGDWHWHFSLGVRKRNSQLNHLQLVYIALDVEVLTGFAGALGRVLVHCAGELRIESDVRVVLKQTCNLVQLLLEVVHPHVLDARTRVLLLIELVQNVQVLFVQGFHELIALSLAHHLGLGRHCPQLEGSCRLLVRRLLVLVLRALGVLVRW